MPKADDRKSEVETSKLSALIPKEIHRRAKVYAAENERDLQDVVAEALEKFIARRDGVPARDEGAAA